ncbi:basic region leucine zipper [Colletotrichum graminicola M1.001]|uniref:Basic region leucine zipper n=1 Tax=Colletotrichum graminicola (strain M1.001 / M2 / FGSC 10212) TaxID=645133 RepID=E3Q768_COLGM|nr:basic region leucine zipper [Colletotrichum graminicola M1.001]EFQ26706.1 basic region leucine zipper [Colletotrichum graminicola M1.001]
MSSVQWEAERQSQQSFEATGPTLHCTTASSVQPGYWPSFQQQQQYLQSPQSVFLSPPLQWPASTDNPLTTAPVPQPPPSKGRDRSKPEPEPGHRATATKKKVTTPARRPVDPRLVSMSQNHPKHAWVGVGGASESPPASSMSYEDKDSDASLAPAVRDRKMPYRVKNRAAAKRCREKTKQYEIDLANKEKQVTKEHMYLDACVVALKNEVLSLKNQILQHSSCDCDMIQGYIARTASTVSVAGNGVPTVSHPSA